MAIYEKLSREEVKEGTIRGVGIGLNTYLQSPKGKPPKNFD